MKRLLLLRHAKAVPHGTLNDFDRPLADRGRSDMARMARHVAEETPDLALVSPAARTRETWERAELPEVETRFEERIYEASLATLLRLVRALPEEASRPILVGHNPGFEEFAGSLAAKVAFPGMPTGALVVAEFPVERWREVSLDDGALVRLVTPGG